MLSTGRKVTALICAIASGTLILAGCSSSKSSQDSSNGPITLRIGLFGTFGYKEAGLYAQYEAAHPNVKIVEDDTEQEQNYWQALQTHMAASSGLDDIQGIEVGRIADVVANDSSKFVDLDSLGASSMQSDWYPWKWQEATTSDGKTLGLGTDIGPMAVCYRTDLLKQAGLPTDRTALAQQWSTWQDYLSLGQKYKAHAPAGSAWMDSASGMYNAMVGQSKEQYYDSSGKLVLTSNPSVQNAWTLATTAAKSGLTAKLAQFGTDWNKGFASGSFATIACPAWMIGYIKGQAGTAASGKWDVAAPPGGTGNWGGSYLAIPKTSKHQQAAYDLIKFLTGKDAEVTLFQKGGNFPSNSQAAASVASVTDPYFNNAPIGQIFSQSAQNMPIAILGPKVGIIQNDVTNNGITPVETQGKDPASAWQSVVSQVNSDLGG